MRLHFAECIRQFIFLALLAGICQGALGSVVEVNKYTAVNQSRDVYLIDLISKEELDPAVASALEGVKITNGPKLGEKRVLSSRVLSKILRRKIKAIKQSSEIHLKIPRNVVIENLGKSLSRPRMEKELSQVWGALCAECKVEIGMLNIPKIEAEESVVSWNIHSDGKLPKGAFSYPVYVRFENGNEKKYWVQGQVRVMKVVAVTDKAISLGQRLRQEDLKVELRDVTYAFDQSVDIRTAIGKQAKRTLAAGQIVYRNALEDSLLVKRGQAVKAILADHNWSLTVQGIAEEGGRLGDTVSIRNPNSNKRLSGEIVGSGEVVIR